MHYARFHFGDYSRDTSHLDPLEHGIYFLLMRVYYTTERPLTNDRPRLYRAVGARNAEQHRAVDAVLGDFFTASDEGWRHKRIDAEIAAYHEKAELNAQVGKLGGRPRKNPEITQTVSKKTQTVSKNNRLGSKNNPDETLTTNQEPLTTNQDSKALSGKPDVSALSREILDFLNTKTGRAYRPVPANLDLIKARLREGYTPGDIRQVIAKKCREWAGDEKMAEYLRPETLFGRTKMAQYSGELVVPQEPSHA